MEKFFEKYRDFLENADLLLIEGRKDVAMSRAVRGVKNEMIKEFAETQMQRLLNADPSGKQKYANWLAGQLNKEVFRSIKYIKDQRMPVEDYIDSVKASIDMMMRQLVRYLPTYHKLVERNLIEKDINKYEEYTDWTHDIHKAEKEFQEKERMKAMAKQAKSETDEIESNEDYMIVRPRSKEGSCYFGQGTKWCISATQSQNYFDSYTSEGKGFYFVFFHHLPHDDTMKKMALVFEPGYDEPSEVYDRPDDEVGIDGLREAVEENLLLKGFWNSLPDKKAVKKIFNKKPEELKKIVEKLQHELEIFREGETVKGQPLNYKGAKLEVLAQSFKTLGIDIEDNNDIEEEFDEMISEQLWEISGTAAHHWGENPAGPTDEDFQSIVDAAELSNVHVNWDEYDEGRMYWDGGMSFDFSNVDDLVEDAVDTDELASLVHSALDANSIYPDDVEDNSWGGDLAVNIRFNPGYGEESGLEGFQSFVDRMQEADQAYEASYEGVIEAMKEKGWIPGESMKALLEKFNEMKFQNFDVELEDGTIEVSSRLHVRLLLPEELRSGDKRLAAYNREDGGIDPRKAMWDKIVEDLKNYDYVNQIREQIIARIKNGFDKAMEIASSQTKLPLDEGKRLPDVPEYKIAFGTMGPKSQGSINRSDNRSEKYTISDTFTYWLDVNIEGEETEEEIKTIQRFLRIIDKKELFEKIRQHVEGLVNNQMQKIIIPAARELVKDKIEVEKTTDELSSLFEGWRKFIQ